MQVLLSREDLIRGIKELSVRAENKGIAADIYVVGGAALALKYFDRDATVDIDARAKQWEMLQPIVEEIANDFDWAPNWFNVLATQFVPALGKDAEWVHIYSYGGVNVFVASAEVLLMMKLAASRRGRDYRDTELLIATTGITNLQELEDLFGKYFPGDVLPLKALRMLDEILGRDISLPPTPPPDPIFE
jgi:hypothetical protein